MKALVWHGKEDIRYDTVSDPQIEDDRDAIIKVTSCAICGSDLHLFHNFIPAMLPGDIMGHEMMGEVVEVGKGEVGKGGVVRDPALHARVCAEVREWLDSGGWAVQGIVESPITGPEGNIEFLIAAQGRDRK